MEDFSCDRRKLILIKNNLTEINTALTGTYEKILALQDNMSDTNCWAGEAHMVAMAFLELTSQYHLLLTEGGNAPVRQACEDLEKYLEVDEVFYDEWESYQKLLGV